MPISRTEFRAMTDEALAEWHRLLVKLEAADARAKDAVENFEQLKVKMNDLIWNLSALTGSVRGVLGVLFDESYAMVRAAFGGEFWRAVDDLDEVLKSAENCLK